MSGPSRARRGGRSCADSGHSRTGSSSPTRRYAPSTSYTNMAASTVGRLLVLCAIATATLIQSLAICWLLDSSALRRAIR